MLKSILVKDYALIEEINIDFKGGLNIITGETGAGKSILIDAMGLLLGERASTEVIRKGVAKSVVEGVFDVEANLKVKAVLSENDIDFQPELIMRREISLKGSNRCFINDTPVNLSLIKDVGNLLVDLHGQHEHQSLLRNETHIEVIDEYCGSEELLKGFTEAYALLIDLRSELKRAKDSEHTLNERKDIYLFQIKEIDQVNPEENEDEKITAELKILENSERLLELTSKIYSEIYDVEDSVHDKLAAVRNDLNALLNIDKSFSEVLGEVETTIALINDVSEFVRNYHSRIELAPEQLNFLRERLSSINLLKKKYGGSIKSILEHRAKAGKEFDLADNFSERIQKITEEIKAARSKCGAFAAKLSKKRIEAAKQIQSEIQSTLSYLGIPDAVFYVKTDQQLTDDKADDYITIAGKPFKYNSRGVDELEFFISTNKGEDPKPLAKVASGGEISRVMLAIKTILAKRDKLPLLIFDEIDSGISGRIAQKVGQSLKSLAEYHQIIAITHLPQIAGVADFHFAVEKKSIEGRVVSSIRLLNEEEKITEVAKLMSGEKITEASIKGAKELMGN